MGSEDSALVLCEELSRSALGPRRLRYDRAMRFSSLLLSLPLFGLGFVVGLGCDYAPSGVSCGDLTCGDGEVCYAYTNSCLPTEYSCISEHEGCAVEEEKDAEAFAACVEGKSGSCEFDPDSEVLSCDEVGDAGC